jgi:serine protease Do
MVRLFTSAILVAGLFPLSHAGAAIQPGAQPGVQPLGVQHEVQSRSSAIYIGAPGRSYLGVDIRDITQDRVAPLKLKEERGVEVTMVDQDAPAGKAGIKEHDVILDFNGAPVESEEQLRRMIRETPVGRTVSLGISRDGNPKKINLQLAQHDKVVVGNHIEIPPLPPMPDMELGNRIDVPNVLVIRNLTPALGVQTENLGQQLGEYFGVKNGEGVLVRSVEKGSPADKAGMKAGDVIVRVADEKLSDRGDLSRVMRKHREGKVTLGIVRDRHEQSVTVDLPQRRSKDSSELIINGDEELADLDASLADMDDSLVSLGDSMADFDVDIEAMTDELANGETADALRKAQSTLELLQGSHNKLLLRHSDSMI